VQVPGKKSSLLRIFPRSWLVSFYFLLCPLVLFSIRSNAQDPPQYMLEINSTGLKVSDKTLGHAFMSIKVRTANGYKEEPFGFYSEPEARGLKDIPRLVVGMPGALRKEFDRHPERFARVDETLQIPITAQQRRDIYSVVQSWDSHHYELLTENCITFISQVAQQIGIPLPNRLTHPTADQYVAALRANYNLERARLESVELERKKQEQARLEAEQQKREKARLELERQRQEQAKLDVDRRLQDQRRRAATAAAAAAAAATEARRIPAGWVPCSCPAVHARFGKYVNGVLYHPNNVRCP
jgi:hypothetical protein